MNSLYCSFAYADILISISPPATPYGNTLRDLFDLQVPFMKPVWRRYVMVIACIGWGIVEFITANPVWGILFTAVGVYAIWQLFIAPWPDKE